MTGPVDLKLNYCKPLDDQLEKAKNAIPKDECREFQDANLYEKYFAKIQFDDKNVKSYVKGVLSDFPFDDPKLSEREISKFLSDEDFYDTAKLYVKFLLAQAFYSHVAELIYEADQSIDQKWRTKNNKTVSSLGEDREGCYDYMVRYYVKVAFMPAFEKKNDFSSFVTNKELSEKTDLSLYENQLKDLLSEHKFEKYAEVKFESTCPQIDDQSFKKDFIEYLKANLYYEFLATIAARIVSLHPKLSSETRTKHDKIVKEHQENRDKLRDNTQGYMTYFKNIPEHDLPWKYSKWKEDAVKRNKF